jgi:hypothetical protein
MFLSTTTVPAASFCMAAGIFPKEREEVFLVIFFDERDYYDGMHRRGVYYTVLNSLVLIFFSDDDAMKKELPFFFQPFHERHMGYVGVVLVI